MAHKNVKEWTRGDKCCPSKISYLGGAMKKMTRSLSLTTESEELSALIVLRRLILLGTIGVHKHTPKQWPRTNEK